MSSVILGFLIDAVISGASWLVRVVRSVLAHAIIEGAARGGKEAMCSMTPSRKDRRRTRKHLKHLADTGDIEELIRAYRRLGRGDEARELRTDAIGMLAAADTVAAEPILQEIIEGSDDTWLVLAALDRAAKHRMIGLLDSVNDARDDHRRVVAKLAGDVHRRLVKAAANPPTATTPQRTST